MRFTTETGPHDTAGCARLLQRAPRPYRVGGARAASVPTFFLRHLSRIVTMMSDDGGTPLFLLYCMDAELGTTIRTLIGHGPGVRIVASDRVAPVDFARANGIIAVLAGLSDRGALEFLSAVQARSLALPIIVVAYRDPEVARLLQPYRIDEIVWVDELRATLPVAVRRARQATFFTGLAELISASEILPVTLRTALTLACRSEPPLPSIGRLASHAACTPRTLQRQWYRAAGAATGLKLNDFLAWLRLMRASPMKTSGASWQRIAQSVGCDARTLRRAAVRLVGLSLEELGRRPPDHTMRRFCDVLLPHLVLDDSSIRRMLS